MTEKRFSSLSHRVGHPAAQQRSHRRVPPSASRLKRLARLLGPGLISGAADDDPTGIATYAQAGARTGYGLLWTTLLTLPMMITVQLMAAKIGIVHEEGLAAVIKRRYPRSIVSVAVLGLIVANLINAGADLGAIAAAINLLVPVSILLLVPPVTLVILLFLIFGSYRLIENTFKWLTLALLAYVVSSFMSHPDWGAAFAGTVVPHVHFNAAEIGLLVAGLGGNVSPYLFFWEADLEVEQERSEGASRSVRRDVRSAGWDTGIGMVMSNVIIYFIEIATAATFFASGDRNVGSAADAARALRPLLGSAATWLWAVGMIGAGLLAVPALAGSVADAVAALFGWRRGLNQPLRRAEPFYLVLAAAMVVSMLVNFLGINPIRALVLSAVVNGILTPPLLVLLVLVANNREVMGERASGRWLYVFGWGTIAIMSLAAVGLLVTLV